MAGLTINDYAAAISIDATNDYFLLEQGSVYKKINRSVILGITGSPVGTSDNQTLTNKAIGNTNTITVKDGSFTLQNTTDTTKQVQFSLTSLTSGITRTLTLPDATATLATLAGIETLTNKTISGAAISGGSIDNSTVTVDSISGHTTSTLVTVGGVQMNNGVLNTANSVTATAIAAGGVQPNALTTGTGTGWSWATYAPVFTNFSLGNGTLNYAKYIQIGKNVSVRIQVTLGGTSAVTGEIIFTTPVSLNSDYSDKSGMVGWCRVTDVSASTVYEGQCVFANSTNAKFVTLKSDGTYLSETGVSASIPMTWATGDVFSLTMEYEAA